MMLSSHAYLAQREFEVSLIADINHILHPATCGPALVPSPESPPLTPAFVILMGHPSGSSSAGLGSPLLSSSVGIGLPEADFLSAAWNIGSYFSEMIPQRHGYDLLK